MKTSYDTQFVASRCAYERGRTACIQCLGASFMCWVPGCFIHVLSACVLHPCAVFLGTLSMCCLPGYTIHVLPAWILHACVMCLGTSSMCCLPGCFIHVLSAWVLHPCAECPGACYYFFLEIGSLSSKFCEMGTVLSYFYNRDVTLWFVHVLCVSSSRSGILTSFLLLWQNPMTKSSLRMSLFWPREVEPIMVGKAGQQAGMVAEAGSLLTTSPWMHKKQRVNRGRNQAINPQGLTLMM